MAVRLVCRACGKRLKLPAMPSGRSAAKCPKCGARVELDAALEASAYLPALPPGAGQSAPPHPRPTPPPRAGTHPGPRPGPVAAKSARPGAPLPLPPEEPLSLDEDDRGPDADPEPPPFRVPVVVLADSARQIGGPCSAVLVPHGVFLEREPMKPFLYAPLGCRAESPAAGDLLVTLPDGRAVTFRFRGRAGSRLARDTRSFLAGQRPVPAAADYRRKWWLLWAALVLALGLVGGPLALARGAGLGLEVGLEVGAGFALVGFLLNATIALVSRRSVPGQLVLMAGACALVTGLFLFGAAAFLAGRNRATAEAAHAPPAPPTAADAQLQPDRADPPPRPADALTVVDRAYAAGMTALEDGPSEVTALTTAPDGNTLGVGYADGTTRLCLFDQPAFDALQPGPTADGPVARVRFDAASRFVFALTPAAAVATTRSGPFATLAKVPGAPAAVAPDLAGDRVRFAAVRGNAIQHRSIAAAFIQRPPAKAKDAGVAYALPGKGDEVVPPGSAPEVPKPAGPTFLAWTPGGRLLAGQPDGGVAVWSSALKAEAVNRDHKAAVRAWADCPQTGDFATGDDKGVVAVWPYRGGKPAVAPVTKGPVVALAFSPSGAWLAAADGTGWVVVWDVSGGVVRHRV